MFARMGLRFSKRFIKADEIDLGELSNLLKYSRNTSIEIDTHDAKVNIKIM